MVNPIFHTACHVGAQARKRPMTSMVINIYQARAVRIVRDDVGALLKFKGVESLDRCLTKMTEK